jgi:hypothetical protein
MRQLSLSAKLVTALLALTLFTQLAKAVSSDVNSVTIDALTIAANQLTLRGTFGSGVINVLLGSTPLPVVSSSSTQIVAGLSPVPAIGTYRLTLTIGNKTTTAYASVSAKILEGIVNADGAVGSGNGFSVVHAFSGNYRINFPTGTFQIGSPYVFPTLVVAPLFSLATANITFYVINGDQSGSFIVDFAGTDTVFSFNLTQTY